MSVTAAGRRWGLSGWWDANWSVDTAAVREVLGLDERGLAAAWVERYGGPPGIAEIPAAAEYRP